MRCVNRKGLTGAILRYIFQVQSNKHQPGGNMFAVIERNAFDSSVVLRGIHQDKAQAEYQAEYENKNIIRNSSEWCSIIDDKGMKVFNITV